MAIKKFVDLDYSQADPPLDEFLGGEQMRHVPIIETMNAQDAALNHGRRILAQVGLHGCDAWHVPDTAPSVVAQSHPLPETAREVARSPRLALTPGHFPRAMLVASPAGQTSVFQDGAWGPGGLHGNVDIEVIFNNGDGTATATLLVPPSLEVNGAQPAGAGAAWESLYVQRTPLLKPPSVVDVDSLLEYVDGTVAEIIIRYRGSPRAIDVVVYEEPFRYAAVTDQSPWMLPLLVNSQGELLKNLPSSFPIEAVAAGVTGGGSFVIVDAAERQRELMPMLWSHSSYIEGEASVTAEEPAPGFVISSTDFLELLTNTPAFSEDEPGASVSSGANGRLFESSAAELVLRDKDNVIPVRCWVYARMTNVGESAVIRFMTAEYSLVEVTVTGTSYAWHAAVGHLRCGLGPQDPSVLQVFGRVGDTDQVCRWQALAVEPRKV